MAPPSPSTPPPIATIHKYRPLVHFVLFGCIGITTEVFFTAICNAIRDWPRPDPSLAGKSYIWMLPIYGASAFLMPPVYSRIARWPVLLRALFYGFAIICIEYLTGFALDMLTGKCPWEYHSRFAIHGYIRLDYFPLWMGFGLMIEAIHRLLLSLETPRQLEKL